MKSLSVTMQIKATNNNFFFILFSHGCSSFCCTQMVVTFESVDKIVKRRCYELKAIEWYFDVMLFIMLVGGVLSRPHREACPLN